MAGEREAVFDRFKPMAVAIAAGRKRPRCIELEDVIQEALMALWAATKNFRPAGSSGSVYLRTRVNGAITDFLRRQGFARRTHPPRPAIFFTYIEPDGTPGLWDRLLGSYDDLDSFIDEKRRRAWLAAAIARLPRCRRAVLERYLRGESLREISESMGKCYAYAHVTVHETVARLRRTCPRGWHAEAR
jgi:RNA polymerase sigma factor (sigma-70 family)